MSNFQQRLDVVTTLHTLGPTGTNCERAAHEWFRRQGRSDGKVVLHATLEKALEELDSPSAALMGCVVYPDLHKIVFNNLDRLVMADCIIMPTDDMVLAARPGMLLGDVRTAGSHPAPASLLYDVTDDVTLCDSNAQAATRCAHGEFDACVTTRTAATREGLEILRSAGQVSMGFTVHCRLPQR
jgi:prephenate dehydratase